MTNRTWEEELENWDRHAWMVDHGEWASAAFSEQAEAREKAREGLAASLTAAANAAAVGSRVDWLDVEIKRAEAEAAEEAMEGCPEGDDDYIAEGVIDPDGVAEMEHEVLWSRRWRGWDCEEGQQVVRVRGAGGFVAIAHNWWRSAYGGQRHERDLWRVLWKETEETEETEEEEEEEEADEADE